MIWFSFSFHRLLWTVIPASSGVHSLGAVELFVFQTQTILCRLLSEDLMICALGMRSLTPSTAATDTFFAGGSSFASEKFSNLQVFTTLCCVLDWWQYITGIFLCWEVVYFAGSALGKLTNQHAVINGRIGMRKWEKQNQKKVCPSFTCLHHFFTNSSSHFSEWHRGRDGGCGQLLVARHQL